MPSSTRSNKEKSLLFSDLALLERTIRKEKRTTSIDNNISSSTDTSQQTSTDTPNPVTDSCELLPIDTSVRTSIDIHPRDMVSNLILERDENGDLHDQEDHLRNAAGHRLDYQRAQVVKEEKLQEGDVEVESSMSFGSSHWCPLTTPGKEHRLMESDEHRSIPVVHHRSTKSVGSCETVRIMTHENSELSTLILPNPLLQTSIDRETKP
ncbi:hypothetical protein F2Q68_00038887 [Brassica cretica]|uniref:Uncharacterized protein n=2 Tax=Brassica cretica TaxID=69181 RepID=A0ABQ7AC07_BRACR|nr:hypothetical protein F2Q68_00038887 [Brassica cretica]KAF3495168.1 hypothetical protein DY000_02052452 [Brassica cretica]